MLRTAVPHGALFPPAEIAVCSIVDADEAHHKAKRSLEELIEAGKQATETSARLTREMRELASQIAEEKAKREDRAKRRN